MKLLLEHGANVNSTTVKGYTALHFGKYINQISEFLYQQH